MIVCTAGHVDHGKTSLVRALTGVDTDRLEEEKKRGLTIDLGFAYCSTERGRHFGFVDVPGHERFVRNMLCGITTARHVLLVVAADDGLMPQTREHLNIIEVLGIRSCLVAVTKTDRVSSGRVSEVIESVRAELLKADLQDAQFYPVSCVDGTGLRELMHCISSKADSEIVSAPMGNFRLAIDRSFHLSGTGTIITGSVLSGDIKVGDHVLLQPHAKEARVRGLHVYGEASEMCHAGERCAMNIAGPDLRMIKIQRGDWAVKQPGGYLARKLDFRVRVPATGEESLSHWLPVHVHIGSAHLTGRVALLEGKEVAPGETQLAQLMLDREVCAATGDALVLRDQSARRTLGGGRVIDIFPPSRGRSRPERLSYLGMMEEEATDRALSLLVASSRMGVDVDKFVGSRNLSTVESRKLLHHQRMVVLEFDNGEKVAFSHENYSGLLDEIVESIDLWHSKNENKYGVTERELLRFSTAKLSARSLRLLLSRLAEAGRVLRENGSWRLPKHRRKLSHQEENLLHRAEKILQEDRLSPRTVKEIAAALTVPVDKLDQIFEAAMQLDRLVRLTPNRVILKDAERHLLRIAQETSSASADNIVSVPAFRERANISRNLAVEVLEFFDRVGYTSRIAEGRVLLRPEQVPEKV